MLTTVLAATALAATPQATPTKISSASLFKNGFAVIVREADISGSGEFMINEIPQATLGTLWITASDGVKIKSVIGTQVKTTQETNVASLDEAISANVGKVVTLTTHDNKSLKAKILSATGSLVVLTSDEGMTMIQKSNIRQLSSDTNDLVWKTTSEMTKPAYRIKTEAPSGGKLYIMSLERGMSWVPAYSADITDPKKLHLVQKATIMNDVDDIEDIDLKLITGFPNIPFKNIMDPFSLQQTVEVLTGALMRAGAPGMMRQAEGFAGQMARNSLSNLRPASFDEAFPAVDGIGAQEEDLFFYTLPDVTLKKGDRGYFVLLGMDAPYEHLYEWSIANAVSGESYIAPGVSEPVWHSLQFKNMSKQPFTTAAALTMKNGELLGQDLMYYTPAGREVTLKITQTLDVVADFAEEEISRDKKSIIVGRSTYNYDDVKLKGTLRVVNTKKEDVKMKITKDLTGTVISKAGNPKVTTLAKGLRAVNTNQQLEWTLKLKPGEKKELTYTYNVLLRL